jgi:uncharacterized protein YndB with AHSA1/START domain
MNQEPVVKEVILNAAPPRVWKAITDKEEMKKWYFDVEEFRPETGFEFTFYGGDDDNKWLHLFRVTEVLPERKLVYSWKYDGYEGISYAAFELFPEGDKTRLRLTHTGLETFPYNEVPQFKKENFDAGWEDIIRKNLKEYIDN